jgi:ABC-type branched-subunit amino acid transport system substrate-binding protein
MFSCLFGTPVMTALKDQTTQDKVMVLYGGNAFSLLSSQNIIIAAQPFVMDVLNGYDYVTNKLGKKNIKSAIIYQDDSLGADGVVGYDAAVKAFGMQDVGKIAYKTSDTDFTAQATALKNSGAEYVYVAGVGAFIGRIITAANALGFNAHYLLQSSAWDPSLMKTNAKDSLAGSILLLSVPSWSETNIPGVATMLAAMKKYAPNQQESSIVSSGWVQAHETYLILKQALESGDVTRDGILKASMTIKNWDFGGLVPTIPSIGTAANDRLPSRGSFIQEIDPSLPTFLKPVADAYTSDAAKSYVFK